MNAIVHWLAVPVEQKAETHAPPTVKYEVPNAVIVRGLRTAYVGIADNKVAEQLLAYPDVETLGAEERMRTEPLPGTPMTWEMLESQIPLLGAGHRHQAAVGLGDVISALTRKARIPECGSCARRRTGLNRITVWGWWRTRKLQLQPEG
ncbi:hypothetical protein ACFYQ5_12275 [Streptomyces sp. NPDC005794]|uniref:hypothetical protein n=1 Tax=Streptomyces sp. NPDC005794 TaxID=3364733 RepID=UPI0036C24B1E